MSKYKDMSVEEIIRKVKSIVNPWWQFNMDDIYGDRGGISYPNIEELNYLRYKLNSKLTPHQTSKECDIMLESIKALDIGDVRIIKVMGVGKFMVIEFTYKILIQYYNNYTVFANANANQEKINEIHQKTNQKVPKDFIGYKLFYKN